MTSRKLTMADAAVIREDGRSHAKIAKDYGVSRQAISAIKAGLTYNTKARVYPVDSKRPMRRGEIAYLGKHTLMCGDATDPDDVAALMPSGAAPLMLTDPPYSSGGFQTAAQITVYSKGTMSESREMAGDMRSSRGYQILIRNVLELSRPVLACIFTDWRMRVYLWDAVESGGLSARSMIVWDKQYPNMGVGWRNQHELIMVAYGRPGVLPKGGYTGNVIRAARERNIWSQTQKASRRLEPIDGDAPWRLQRSL